MVGTSRSHSISFEELESLRKVRRGVGATTIPGVHRVEFLRRGWMEEKYGGIVLTSVGRYQLDLRARETGLALIANRWQRRARELRELADSTTSGDTRGVRSLADRWEMLAAELLQIEKLEESEPMLGDGTDGRSNNVRR